MAPLLDSELIKQVVARMAAQESPADPMFPRMAAREPRIAQDDTEGGPETREYAPRRLEGREPPPAPVSTRDLLKDAAPVLISQILDGLSTQQFLGARNLSESGIPVQLVEHNPLPGMQHAAGRAAWAMVENVLVNQLKKHAPRVGRAAEFASAAMHTGLANGNKSTQTRYEPAAQHDSAPFGRTGQVWEQ
jgi:hypothetical protein